jgi:hypothetical protein
MDISTAQICKRCKISKPLLDFYKDSHCKPLGRKYICKPCTKEQRLMKTQEKRTHSAMTSNIQSSSNRPRLTGEYNESDEEEEEEEVAGTISSNTENNESEVDKMKTHVKIKVGLNKYIYVPVEHGRYPPFNYEDRIVEGKHYSFAKMGSRNSGKTTHLRHEWPFWRKRYDFIIFFCNSVNAPIYKTFMTDDERHFMFKDYDPNIIDDLERLQDLTENEFHILIIFDDCSSYNHKSSDEILQLYIRGRNMNISVMFSTQSLMFLHPDSRGNTDFCDILKQRIPNMKLKLIENFLLDTIPIPPEVVRRSDKITYLSKWIDLNTKDHNIIVLDFLNEDEMIFSYKVPQEEIDAGNRQEERIKKDKFLRRKRARENPEHDPYMEAKRRRMVY